MVVLGWIQMKFFTNRIDGVISTSSGLLLACIREHTQSHAHTPQFAFHAVPKNFPQSRISGGLVAAWGRGAGKFCFYNKSVFGEWEI